MACCNHKPHKESLFCDDYLVKEGNFDENIFREYLQEAVRWVEDYVVDKVIGRCIYDHLHELICSGEIDNDGNECWLNLRDYLLPIYIYGLKSELPMNLTYKEKNAGLVKTADNDSMVVSTTAEIASVSSRYQSKMNHYIQRAAEYIYCCGCFGGFTCCCPSLAARRSQFGMSMSETSPRYTCPNYFPRANRCFGDNCYGGTYV